MRTIITGLVGLAACALLATVAGPKPAVAMPMANLGASPDLTAGDQLNVQWRRYPRRYWAPRFRGPRYWRPRYYSYGYYPYYRRYWGPRFYVGPRGFSFGWW